MEALAQDALAAYRNLVYETPGFNRYFQETTPIREIAGLNIGSRPPSRKKSDLIEDLRAIPWVLSWSVNRSMIPGWYGFGTAVAIRAARKQWRKGLGAPWQEMHRDWPFLQTLLSNMDMALGKNGYGYRLALC